MMHLRAVTDVFPAAIEYPERDGKPIGESDAHCREILETIMMLELYFRDVADVYISGNLMFYYEEGDPGAVVSPDVFVVKGVAKKLRRTYKLREERHAPVTVFEITSRSTRLEDKGNKRALFAMLGVREYFMFDPLNEYLKPSLQGFRLVGEDYVAIAPEADGALVSQELGLRLRQENTYLRLFDLRTGQQLLRPAQLEEAHQAAEQEVERLRAELARLRGAQSGEE